MCEGSRLQKVSKVGHIVRIFSNCVTTAAGSGFQLWDASEVLLPFANDEGITVKTVLRRRRSARNQFSSNCLSVPIVPLKSDLTMLPSTFQSGEQQRQCCNEADKDLKNLEDRRDRYEHLKNSVAVLRSRFRSTPTASPCTPSSPSSQHNTDLVPYSEYFSVAAMTTKRDKSSRSSYYANQIEACSLLESYAMQALRLDCEARLKEGREELDRVRDKLKDKVRRTELFDRELEKQRRKLEGRIEFYAERAKSVERQLAEQSTHHKEEMWAQTKAFSASRELQDEERRQQVQRMMLKYEDAVASLKGNNEKQLAEIQMLKEELSNRLEQMDKTKQSTEDQLKYLDGQLKMVAQQSETFRMSYEEQDREWNLKLQHITAMHQYQTKILSEDFELKLEKLRNEMKEERDQQNSKLQAYKAQKLLDMENVEQRVKGVLEMKDLTITNLKLELKVLHQQLNDSVGMLDDVDPSTGSLVKPV